MSDSPSPSEVAANVGRSTESSHAGGGVCEPLLAQLKACLLKSDCVLKQQLLPSDCLKNHFNELPEPCQQLRVALFDCKRAKVRRPPFISLSSVQLGMAELI